MTDQELKDLVASLAVESKKTDEKMKETAELMKKSDEKLARMGIHLAGISNNQGDVAEEYFVNSLKNISIG
jgi:archaellum component FlaC